MKNTSRKTILANRSIPAIVAVGSSLAALPAMAMELGEISVQSRLGQPLRASIAYALGPNEQIANHCVTMRPGASVSGLPSVGPATVSVANGVIMLAGNTPVREPMVSAHVIVNCPYSANLSREYMLFIDPLLPNASPAYEAPVVTQQASPSAATIVVQSSAVNRPVASVRPAPVIKDIASAASYRVQSGETLSEIAQRIENRSVGLWTAVDQIFVANPDAFINKDPNRLKAGSILSIPSFDGRVAIVTTNVAEPVVKPALVATPSPAELLAQTAVDTIVETTAQVTPAYAALEAYDPAGAAEYIANEARDIVVLDANLEGPKTTSISPNVPTAIIRSSNTIDNGTASPSWVVWLAGSGIAIIFGLLMFGRRFRSKKSSDPTTKDVAESFGRRQSDFEESDTAGVAVVGAVDFDLSDDTPTEENLSLDADLIMGTGLEKRTQSNATHDFNYASASNIDIELPFEPEATVTAETDMLPIIATDEVLILDSEILPEDDDYDMSVIVDATKMPRPEDVTERDLQAIEITQQDEAILEESYTINQEVDYRTLEQDYEDEFTATQALNKEIARAAAELHEHLGDDDSDDDLTTALPLASVTELDITAQMPATNDDVSDLDDTGVNAAITQKIEGEEETREMPAKSGKAG